MEKEEINFCRKPVWKTGQTLQLGFNTNVLNTRDIQHIDPEYIIFKFEGNVSGNFYIIGR